MGMQGMIDGCCACGVVCLHCDYRTVAVYHYPMPILGYESVQSPTLQNIGRRLVGREMRGIGTRGIDEDHHKTGGVAPRE
jgi:hypothetical protein